MDVMEKTDPFLLGHEQFSKRVNDVPSWLEKRRSVALAHFKVLGPPTRGVEQWRFTNVRRIAALGAVAAGPGEKTLTDLSDYSADGATIRMIFENGFFRADLSELDNLPKGLRLRSLAEVLGEHAQAPLTQLDPHVDSGDEAFTALNGAFMEDGVFLEVAANTVLETPIQLLFVGHAADSPRAAHPRNLIAIGENAEVTLVEAYVGQGAYWTNAVTQIDLAPSARLTHYYKQRESERACHVTSHIIRANRDSRLVMHNLLTGSELMRHNIEVSFTGEGAEAQVNGLYVADGDQHLDNYIHMDHQVPHCSSDQFFKGILDGKGQAIFTGKVTVRPDAQKTDAKQANRNLLLSESARIDTQPQLEIYADDVKCAHGATTGQIDPDALFYLQSRGIDPKSARELLLFAFAKEVIERLPHEAMRQEAESFLNQRFSSASLSGDLP